jgi:hypothetical protein
MDRILTKDSFSFVVKLVHYFLLITHQTLETFKFYFYCFSVREKKFKFSILKSEFIPPPLNDAIGAVTNRYFRVNDKSGRVPHGEHSDR